MISKLGLLKQAAFVVCCAASVGAMPLAHADSFGISVGTGPGYYNGGYNNGAYYNRPVNYRQRCVRDYYGAVHCRTVRPVAYYNGPAYYSGPAYYNGYGSYGGYNGYNGYGGYGSSYGPAISLSYFGGWNHRDNDDRRDRDDGNRWRR